MALLIEQLSEHGDKVAVVHRGKEHSYSELAVEITRYEKLLQDAAVSPTQTVAIVSDYSFAAIAAFFALANRGNIVVPITSTAQVEIDERLAVGGVDQVLSLAEQGPQIQPREHQDEKHDLLGSLNERGRAGLVLFSSGSTGKPKAMVHDLTHLLSSFEGKRARELRLLVFLIFDHIGGLNTLFNAVGMGACVVLPESRRPEHICELIEQHRIKVLPASPTFLNLILMSGAHREHSMKSLRMITYGTEPMPPALLLRLKAEFPKVKLLQTFGTSETGIAQTFSKSSSSTLMKINDPKTEYKIVDGELWLRSKTQVLGYLNSSMERFTDDGWFRTGDIAEETEDGYLKISGRTVDVINVGGEKVLPSEVESVVLEVAEVDDVVAYPKANAITGQSVAVDVVLKEGADASAVKSQIRKLARQRLDRFKMPTKIRVVERTEFSERFKKLRAR